MRRGIALGGARTPGAADVAHGDAARRLLEAVADRAPRAHVLRLLLCPDDLLEVRVRVDQPVRRDDRERIELLDPRDRDAVVGARIFPADDVVVDLPGAE